MIDMIKKFWDKRPCNIRHGTAPVGSREYFDQVEARRDMVEPHILTFADHGSWKDKSVLELGCGIGSDAVKFARAGARYTGIELSDTSLGIARRRFEVYGLRGAFLQGNIEELTSFLPIHRYDLVYSFGVIHHTPNPHAVVRQAQEYMHEDSLFRLMLYAAGSWKDVMIKHGLDQPEAQSGCPLAKTFWEDEVRGLLQDYQITDMRRDHIFPYIIEKYIRHEHEIQPWFRAMPAEIFQALKKELGWHWLIECRKGGLR